ncbi:MAG TPA: four-carbon acid sugar kinase family protein [Candidatus Synoicihabitans sp.]|nr:four-carbon acid sugar kinase family protein [Candidatus Synoicihabitans sp.]
MTRSRRLLLAYYADDFTGATDALEWLERAGVRTRLYLRSPTPEELAHGPTVQAIGLAGATRGMSAAALETELRGAFARLRDLQPRHVHYKVCSTFDSSPAIGSIGRAIEIGAEVFATDVVPVVGGAPALGRFCVFGNLFAEYGIGSRGEIHRLDRHPAMTKHPVTPADESDLRRHLGRQTTLPISLIDVREMNAPAAEVARREAADAPAAPRIVLIDTLTSAHVSWIGEFLRARMADGTTGFVVGPSSVEQALGEVGRKRRRPNQAQPWPKPGPVERLLVVSGSCSPVTAGQIAWARRHGFAEVFVAPAEVARNAGAVVETAAQAATALLAEGRHVIVHTLGAGVEPQAGASAAELGDVLGHIARITIATAGVRRLLIAGGDTSGHVARAVGIEALDLVAPFSPGAPLCRVCAPPPIDGLEVVVKGGQVGAEDHFGRVATGEFS